MPQKVQLDKNGVDITDVKLIKEEIATPKVKNYTRLPYMGYTNLNLSPNDVSLYDLNINQISNRPDMGVRVSQPLSSVAVEDLINFGKMSIPNVSPTETPIGKIKRITAVSSTVVDPFSNTSLSTLGPQIARNQVNLPYPNLPNPTVSPNESPVSFESINRDAVHFYNKYKLLNFQHHGALEDKSQTSAAADKVLVRRLSEARNTYGNPDTPKVHKHGTKVIAPIYEKKSKFEDNHFYSAPVPQILSTMKSFDKRYEQELKLL